jgi:hypothetical protein
VIPLPVGDVRQDRKEFPLAQVSAFAAGAVVSSAMLGTIVGVFGWIASLAGEWVSRSLLAMIVFVLVACIAGELCGRRLRFPSRSWQIPRSWAAYGTPRFQMIFGAILGTGFLTFITFGGYYVLLFAIAMIGSPVIGAKIMVCYAAGRWLPVAFAGVRRSRFSMAFLSSQIPTTGMAKVQSWVGRFLRLGTLALMLVALGAFYYN